MEESTSIQWVKEDYTLAHYYPFMPSGMLYPYQIMDESICQFIGAWFSLFLSF